jgi:acyl-CoA synthetase (AMP-forming)/AMP-acid ligase II
VKQNQTKEHHTLTEMFESSCITYECYPAIICNDAIVSYAKMGELSRNIAAWLQNETFLRVVIVLLSCFQIHYSMQYQSWGCYGQGWSLLT